ncbi:wax ester/triacylglycerol synthase family O-acyltransferase [Marinobacteraceae bacterium S3BR75-40.1]
MKVLTPLDQLFLWLEKNQQPMHVGGLQLFSYPENEPEGYMGRLQQWLREFNSIQPPFNQRLSRSLGQLVWVEDKAVDLEHHLRFEALPRPGRIRELLAFVSNEHSHLLDRERPLWEMHLIEGLQDRRFALYTKFHHGFVDGISAMRVLQAMLSEDPATRDHPPFWAMPAKASPAQDVDGSMLQTLRYLLRGSSRQIGTIPAVARELMHIINQARKAPENEALFQAPASPFNQHISNSRRFAAQSYSLARIQAVGHAHGATVNDVLLSMCGHALRRHLQCQNALPERSLVAMVPVSLRQDDSAGGNQVGMMLASLGTHLADPLERLAHIRTATAEAKARYRKMTPEAILNYNALLLAPACFQLLTGLAPRWQTFNLVISNVPGPKQRLYWNGAPMEGMYPVSIPFDRLALNMTLTSYRDEIAVGLIGCRRTVPSLQRMLDYLSEALEQMASPDTL